MYRQTSGALVAVLERMVFREAEAEVRALFRDIRALVQRVVARTREGRLQHGCVQQRIACHLI